jgi:menaquinone-9 beta-reductase
VPDVDVLIAGAGPVGLYTAIAAARSGFSVAVTDPRAQPIDKACGEGLMPSALSSLHDLGLDPPGHVIGGIEYVAAGQRVSHRFRSAVGRGVRRTVLVQELLRLAEADGVKVLQDRVREFHQHPDHVQTPLLTASWLIAADGLRSRIRAGLDLTVPHQGPARFGLRSHFAIAPWSDLVEVHWGSTSEVYVTPVAPNLVGVALLGSRGMGFEAELQKFPELTQRLSGATASPVRGAGPLRVASRQRRSHRIFLVGDAAGYVDALTGEGLTSGFAQARALVDCLAEGRPDEYEREWIRTTRRRDLVTRGVLALAQSRARNQVVPIAKRAPWLFAMGVEAAS